MDAHSLKSDVEEPSSSLISAIHIQMPDFMRSDPEFWILRREAVFEMFSVRSAERRYAHLMSALPESIALDVWDFFHKWPEGDSY